MSSIPVPLSVLASRLGFEPAELVPAGADRLNVEPRAGCGRAAGRWIVVADSLSAPIGSQSTAAVLLTEAFERLGHVAVATFGAPRLGQNLAGRALGGLSLDLEGLLRPHGAEAAVRDGAQLLVAIAEATTQVAATRSAFESELVDLLQLVTNERELARNLGAITLGLTAGGERIELRTTPGVPSVLGVIASALGPTLARTTGESAALIAGAGWDVAGVATTHVAMGAADFVVANARGRGLAGVRRILDLVAPRVGVVPELVVLSASLSGLRWHSGALSHVRARELERVLSADDPALVLRGAERLLEQAQVLGRWRMPVACALELHDESEREQVEALAVHLEESGLHVFLCSSENENLAGSIARADRTSPHPHTPRSEHAGDLAALATSVAQAAGAVGSVAIAPDVAAQLLHWSSIGFANADVLLEGWDGASGTLAAAQLETGARCIRLQAAASGESSAPFHDAQAWNRLRFDSWGRVQIP